MRAIGPVLLFFLLISGCSKTRSETAATSARSNTQQASRVVQLTSKLSPSAATAADAIKLSGVGTGCADGYCLWITGEGFSTAPGDIVVEVKDSNWKLVGTYSKDQININTNANPQAITLALTNDQEKKALLAGGLIVTVSDAGTWDSAVVAAPQAIKIASTGASCDDGYCLWIQGSGFAWATDDITVQVKDMNWNLIGTYTKSQLAIDTSANPQVITLRLASDLEKSDLLKNGLIVTVSNQTNWDSAVVGATPFNLIATGAGWDNGYCLWVQATGLTADSTVLVKDSNWNLLTTYSGSDLNINFASSPQVITLALKPEDDAALLAGGLILTVTSHSSTIWDSSVIAAPTPLKISAVGTGCSAGFCLWVQGAGFSWANTGITAQVSDSSGNILKRYANSELTVDLNSDPQVITLPLTTAAEQSALLASGVMVAVSNGTYADSAAVPASGLQLSAAGYGCGDDTCVWVQGSGFTQDSTIAVSDLTGAVLNTYSGKQLNIKFSTSPPEIDLQLISDAEKNDLRTTGLILTVSSHKGENQAKINVASCGVINRIPITAVETNQEITGWSVRGIADGTSIYSSNVFPTDSNTNNVEVAAWIGTPVSIGDIHLRARDGNQGFPAVYQVFVTNPDNTAWVPLGPGSFSTQPNGNGVAVIHANVTTSGVRIIPTTLGMDGNGSYYFQLGKIDFMPPAKICVADRTSLPKQGTPQLIVSTNIASNYPSATPAGNAIPAGIFVLGNTGTFASDGVHYCGFDTGDHFQSLTGLTSIAQVPTYQSIPSVMIDDGVCTPSISYVATGGQAALQQQQTTAQDAAAQAPGPASTAGTPNSDPYNIFVDPVNGDDNNSGARSAPVRTLEGTRAKVRAINQNMTHDIGVNLLPGWYNVPAGGYALSPADSGFNGHYVNYNSTDRANTIISGGVGILASQWSVNDAAKGIYVAHINAANFRQLYENGQRANRSRYYLPVPAPSDLARTAVRWPLTLGYTYSQYNNPLNGMAVANMEVVGMKEWMMYRCPVTGVSANAIALSSDCLSQLNSDATGYMATAFPMWAENNYNFIQKPGDWYYAADSGNLYYKPFNAAAISQDNAITYPVANELITCVGSANIAFQNLTFTYTNDATNGYFTDGNNYVDQYGGAALSLQHSANVIIANDTFENLGGAGVVLRYASQNNMVTKNTFVNIAGAGVIVGTLNGGDGPQVTRENIISDNRISNIGLDYFDQAGIIAGYNDGLQILHNTISHTPYDAINLNACGPECNPGVSVGNTNANVQGNLLSDFGEKLTDMGGIYTAGLQKGTRIQQNCLSNIHQPGSVYDVNNEYIKAVGIYLDSYSNGEAVTDNFVAVSLIGTPSRVFPTINNEAITQANIGAAAFNNYVSNNNDASVCNTAGPRP